MGTNPVYEGFRYVLTDGGRGLPHGLRRLFSATSDGRGQQRAQQQDRDRDRQLRSHRVGAGVETVDDARDGDVHDGEIEQDHEEAKAEDKQNDPGTAPGLNRRLHMA
jgi:hypothetical protein